MRLNLQKTKVKFYKKISDAVKELELNESEARALYRAAEGPKRIYKEYYWRKIDWEE
jgi:hypothetical protein